MCVLFAWVALSQIKMASASNVTQKVYARCVDTMECALDADLAIDFTRELASNALPRDANTVQLTNASPASLATT